MTDKKSTEFYDVLRVIATILVVIGHAGYITRNVDSGEISLATDNASRAFFFLYYNIIGKAGEWIYGFHMPLFFMLSGALYTYSRKLSSFNDLIKNKALRLIVPYYLVGIVYMFPLKRMAGFYTEENYVEALQGFLLGNNSAHLWFLLVLFWCFIMFYPVEKYVMRKNIWGGVILVCCIYYWGNNGVFDSTVFSCIPMLRTGLSYLPYFMMGYLVEEFRKKYDFSFYAKIFLTFVFLILSYLQYYEHLFSEELLVIILGSATVYAVSYWTSRIPHFMNTTLHKVLLRNSMYIYLFHDPINFLILRWAIERNVLVSQIGSVIFFAMRTVGVILISILIGEIIRIIKKKSDLAIIRSHSCTRL